MKAPWQGLALCATIAIVVMFAELGGPRLWDRDEPRNAGCAAEMLQRGDWVTPVFNGELRSHKPVLLYWLMMPGYQWLGVSEFTARLPSAALAVGTCLLTFFLGRRLFGPEVGVLAPIILCTSLMFVIAGRAATPDSVLIFLTTAATAVYVGWAFPAPGVTRDQQAFVPWGRSVLMYGLMGAAVLAKGPVGLVLPTAVIGMFLLLQRLPPDPAPADDRGRGRRLLRSLWRSFAPAHFLRTCWHMRPLTAIAVASAVALPWYLWVGARTDGAWLQGFFLEHNVGRALRPMESHAGGPLFYPLAILIGLFPWSVFFTPTLVAAWRSDDDRPRRAITFCLCWAGVYVALFSIARTKLPSYVTPCYPGLALLLAWQLVRWQRGADSAEPRWMKAAVVTIGVVGLAMAVGLPIAAHLLLPGEEWLGVGGLIPLAAAVFAWRLLRQQRRRHVVQLLSGAAVAMVLAAFAWMSQHVSQHQQFDELLTAIRTRSQGTPRIATFRCMEPSWVFYAGQQVERVWLPQSASAAEREAERRRPAWSPNPKLQDLQQYAEQDDAFIITTDRQYRRHQAQLPADLEVVARAPLFLKDAELMVLQRRASVRQGSPHLEAAAPGEVEVR